MSKLLSQKSMDVMGCDQGTGKVSSPLSLLGAGGGQ